jgi:hypothetical protein
MNMKNMLSQPSAVSCGADLLKKLKQASVDLEEKGAKYHPDIESEARVNLRKYESLVIDADMFERSRIEDGALGRLDRRVEWAKEILNAAEEALAATHAALDQSCKNDEQGPLRREDVMAAHQGMRPGDILVHLNKLSAQRVALEEAKKMHADRISDQARGRQAFEDWKNLHNDLFELVTLLEKEPRGMRFRPFDFQTYPLEKNESARRNAIQGEQFAVADEFLRSRAVIK